MVELSVVLAIISVVAVMGLELTAQYMNRTAYKVTAEKLEVIDKAIARYVKVYNKIPCPAGPGLVLTSACYGKEASGSASAGACNNTYGTCYAYNLGSANVQYGDVPVRDLGLPLNYMVDGYGSRIRYFATGGQFYDRSHPVSGQHFENTPDAIEVRSGKLDSNCGSAGQLCQRRGLASYFLLSHGADRRGAITPNNNGVSINCNLGGGAAFAKVDGQIDTQNCRFGNALALVKNGSTVISPAIPDNVLYDSRFNNGTTDAHFDDIVKWRSKGNL